MSAVTNHMAMLQLFLSSIANSFNRHIKIKVLARQGMVSINSYSFIRHCGNSDRNRATLTSLGFKLHTDFDLINTLK